MKTQILAIVFMAAGTMSTPSYAQHANNSGSSATFDAVNWEGLWVAEKSFGPQLKGPVTVQSSGNNWIARLQGETVTANRVLTTDGSINWSFEFFDQGRFIGKQPSPDAQIDGHWFQPLSVVEGYPWATPVHLKSAGNRAFGGEVRPFPQHVTLNIPLIANDSNSSANPAQYRTFLRNPERNLGRFFRIETAAAHDDGIQFSDGDGEMLALGRSIEPGERFTLMFPRFGETFDFTRRDRQNAPGFYPRRFPQAPVNLLPPPQTGDGWSTAAPVATGLDTSLLERLTSEIAAFEPTELRQPYIHSILIAHKGKLVLEEYFHGHHRNIPHDSRSAGKSLASALLGIAIHQGALASVDEPVYPLFGGVNAFANPDPRKERMTVRHLITMSSGLNCDDGNYDNPGNEDTMQSQTEQPDWYKYMLDLSMVRDPGEASVYCSGGLSLVGGTIQKATGISLPDFFERAFAKPLQIDYYQMNLSPTYDGYMGGGIRLRPRDFLKMGQLYLDGGVWNARRIVSEDWVRESTAPQASINRSDDYGFAWWRNTYDVKGRAIETYSAAGNGGQNLFVVPELDLVVMINAGNYSDGRTVVQFRDRYMQDFILAAALNKD